MNAVASESDLYTAEFARFAGERAAAGSGDWLDPLRQAAIREFSERGFPTTVDEDWRKTSVLPIARGAFRFAGRPAAHDAHPLTSDALDVMSCPSGGAPRLVFMNGRYAPELSSPPTAAPGVRVLTLEQAVAGDRGLLEPRLGMIAAWKGAPFTALNTAFLQDGAVIEIADDADAGTLHLLFATCSPAEPIATHPRVLLVAGRRSRITLVEAYAGACGSRYFTNAVTEVAAAEGARIEHCRLQCEAPAAFHIGTTRAVLAAGASYTSHAISLGAILSRHDLGVTLSGERAACTLNGLYMLTGRQHADNQTTIEHAMPRCESRELYKGALSGHARAVFNGRVIVRPDAAGTDSRQVNRNLLLSDDALVDTKPELQIHNNDVKCTHAATIGQLDETSVFYLRARGLDREAARSLLIHAFVAEVVGKVGAPPLREALEDLMLATLPGYRDVKEVAL